MKRRPIITLLLGVILGAAGLATGVVFAEKASKSQEEYTIPADLTPVSEWKNGFTAEEAAKFRRAWTAADFSVGNDVTAFVFLNHSEVLPTMVVQRGDGQVAELETSPMPEIADIVATTDLGTMPLSRAMADPRSRVQAIAVLHKGKIVYETYPGMPRTMKHVWNSASKTITGLMIHLLVRDGRIDLKAPVSTYLKYTKGSPVGDIKVEDFLHQRSGLDFEETQANIQNINHPLGKWFATSLSARGLPAGPTVAETIVEIKAAREPNTAFEYSTLNTQILGLIIEAVTDEPINRFISKRLWSKAGMEEDMLLGLSSAGDALSGGGFASTLHDFARFALLFTPSWKVVSKERIVSADYLKTVYAAVNPDIYLNGHQGPRMVRAFGEDDPPLGCAYQWDAIFKDGDLYKAGLGGQAIYVSPETDTVVVYFSTTWQNSLSMISYARAIVKQAFRKN